MYDYGVYILVDESYDEEIFLPYMDKPIKGRLLYIGRGVIDINNLELSRALNHNGDMMVSALSLSLSAAAIIMIERINRIDF
jgi:hypothetical protein